MPSNIALNATPPKVTQHETPKSDPTEIRQLVSAAEADEQPILAAAIALAAITAARRGELCGLRWSDVDVETGVIHLRQAVRHGIDKRVLEIGPTKTGRARRITLDTASLQILAAHRARVEGWAHGAGIEVADDGYILSPLPGGHQPMRPDSLTEGFRRLRKKLGLTLTFHDLRHFTATQLIGAGIDARTVADRLGHADASTTLRIYAGVLDERSGAAARTIGALVAGPPKSLPGLTEPDLLNAEDACISFS